MDTSQVDTSCGRKKSLKTVCGRKRSRHIDPEDDERKVAVESLLGSAVKRLKPLSGPFIAMPIYMVQDEFAGQQLLPTVGETVSVVTCDEQSTSKVHEKVQSVGNSTLDDLIAQILSDLNDTSSPQQETVCSNGCTSSRNSSTTCQSLEASDRQPTDELLITMNELVEKYNGLSVQCESNPNYTSHCRENPDNQCKKTLQKQQSICQGVDQQLAGRRTKKIDSTLAQQAAVFREQPIVVISRKKSDCEMQRCSQDRTAALESKEQAEPQGRSLLRTTDVHHNLASQHSLKDLKNTAAALEPILGKRSRNSHVTEHEGLEEPFHELKISRSVGSVPTIRAVTSMNAVKQLPAVNSGASDSKPAVISVKELTSKFDYLSVTNEPSCISSVSIENPFKLHLLNESKYRTLWKQKPVSHISVGSMPDTVCSATGSCSLQPCKKQLFLLQGIGEFFQNIETNSLDGIDPFMMENKTKTQMRYWSTQKATCNKKMKLSKTPH